ncbi:hypothetical protein [Roseateles sp.]|uniref:hypothetical protein n=1 Tax=Roseateles sp. TaxID=1971397 RepID=UPI003BAC80B1
MRNDDIPAAPPHASANRLHWPTRLARTPWRAATLLALGLALVTVPAGLGTALLAHAALAPAWFGSSAASSIGALNGPMFLLVGVLLMPALETSFGQAAPMALLRRLRVPPPARVIACGVFFGSLHWLGGGLGHGLSTTASGCLFALAYEMCRSVGFWPAAYAAFATHATHNFLMWFVLGPLL